MCFNYQQRHSVLCSHKPELVILQQTEMWTNRDVDTLPVLHSGKSALVTHTHKHTPTQTDRRVNTAICNIRFDLLIRRQEVRRLCTLSRWNDMNWNEDFSSIKWAGINPVESVPTSIGDWTTLRNLVMFRNLPELKTSQSSINCHKQASSMVIVVLFFSNWKILCRISTYSRVHWLSSFRVWLTSQDVQWANPLNCFMHV